MPMKGPSSEELHVILHFLLPSLLHGHFTAQNTCTGMKHVKGHSSVVFCHFATLMVKNVKNAVLQEQRVILQFVFDFKLLPFDATKSGVTMET